MTLPPYISYSQANDYERCPRSWYLSKIRQAESIQTWYVPIGSAVHLMVEDYLAIKAGTCTAKVEEIQAKKYFFPLISAQLLIEPDMSKWLSGGPKDAPVTGDVALQRVKDCYERALEFLDDLDVWEVEYDASGRLPGLSVELRAYVDIIGEYKGKVKKARGPMIVDWKSGSTKPKDFQLRTYAALLKEDSRFKDLKFFGKYAMLAPGASDARPVDLSDVDPAEVGAKYQKIREGMESMQIQANPSKFGCGYCFNQLNCLAAHDAPLLPTNRQIYYDRSRHDQPPF